MRIKYWISPDSVLRSILLEAAFTEARNELCLMGKWLDIRQSIQKRIEVHRRRNLKSFELGGDSRRLEILSDDFSVELNLSVATRLLFGKSSVQIEREMGILSVRPFSERITFESSFKSLFFKKTWNYLMSEYI